MQVTRSGKILKSSQLSQQKTRTGCGNCKSRKTKLNKPFWRMQYREMNPSCLNCIKYSVPCNFAEAPIASSPAIPPAPPSNPPSDAGGLSMPNGKLPNTINTSQLPNLNILDLELLHNFCTSTCFSMSLDPTMKTLWRIKVPQIGFSNGFVMRGILAVSALHLARIHPEKRGVYDPYSIQQYGIALREVSAILPEVTTENCTALHLFATITCIYTFGSPQKPSGFVGVGESGAAEWLLLIRGVRVIIESSSQALFSGPMSLLFEAGQRHKQLREAFADRKICLEGLRHAISETAIDKYTVQIYMRTIDELEKSFTVMYRSPQCEMADVFIWFFSLSDEYLILLKGRTQESLAIFAYLCVLFQKLEYYWWMEGWGAHLMSQIYDLLDEEHRLWIRWPIEQIGWIPN